MTAEPPADLNSTYRLAVTERCNQRCIFCFAAPHSLAGGGTDVPEGALRERLSAIRRQGFRRVTFTGGEPTLHPRLRELLDFAAGLGLSAAVNTNAVRFADPRFLAAFRGAAFDCLVSFHAHRGPLYDRLTKSRTYAAAVRGILHLLRAGVRVRLSLVLNSGNYREFPGWAAFVRRRFLPAANAAGTGLCADVFLNMEVDSPEPSMVRFREVRPFLRRGLERAGFPVEYRTACTVSDCLFTDGFHEDPRHFSDARRSRSLRKLRALPLQRQQDLLNYFVPDRCCACELFLNPTCKGIRKRYLLRFGCGEFAGLLSPEEKRHVASVRSGSAPPGGLRSCPHVVLSGRDAGRSIPELTRILREDKDPSLRREAARALRDLGAAASGAESAIIAALDDEDDAASGFAALTLCLFSPLSPRGARALLRALRHPDPEVRREVSYAVSRREVPAAAFPDLLRLLTEADPRTRMNAVMAIARVRPPPPEAADALADALRDPDGNVRKEASFCLARHGAAPARGRPSLLAALKDPDPQVRANAAQVLRSSGAG